MNTDENAELTKLKNDVMFYWIRIVDQTNPKGVKVFNVYNGDLKGNARHADKSTGMIDSWKSITLNLIER